MRRAFVFATLERYSVMALNLLMVPVVSRLMGPAEFGISVLGLAALMIADTVRDFGTTAYIVQQTELTKSKLQTAFTVTLLLTIVITAGLFALAGPLAQFYRVDGLKYYFEVVAVCFLLGPFVQPIHALQRRDMDFAALAQITTVSTIINVGATILLAYLGYSYMSFAWANLASGVTGALLGLYMRPEFSVFRLSFAHWREMIRFGRYDALSSSLASVWDFVPYLIFGRLLDPLAVGLYQRAVTIANLPRKTLLGGVGAIVLSTMSMKIRAGEDPKGTYLKAVQYVTALNWPSLVIIALLAHPIANFLLGPRWQDVAPLAQMISIALMLNYSVTLTYATLVVMGAVRDAAVQYMIVVPLSTLAVFVAAHFGLWAVAGSMFFTVPLEAAVATVFLRRYLHFSIRELALALRSSALITAATAAGPLTVIALSGFDLKLGLVSGGVALVLGGLGWFCAIWATGHPLAAEISRVQEKALQFPVLRRFRRLPQAL